MAVEIVTTVSKDFNCHNCDEVLKRERGCEEKGIVPFHYDNEVIFRCPIKLITPLSWEYLKAFNFYQKSILPNGNNWMNESNKFLEAMMIIENEQNRLINEQEKKWHK